MPKFTYQAHLDQIPRKLVTSEGENDGNKAVSLAMNAGFPAGSILYFDCESPDQDDVWMDYFLGWCNAVKSNNKPAIPGHLSLTRPDSPILTLRS
jgi:hypothetical protein